MVVKWLVVGLGLMKGCGMCEGCEASAGCNLAAEVSCVGALVLVSHA